MQIASQYKRKHNSRWKNLPTVLAILALIGISILAYLSQQEKSDVYFCDMEKSVESANGHRFKAGWAYFLNGQTQTAEQSFNGEYAAKCDLVTKYGPTLILEKVNSGDIIEASVWQQSDAGYGSLVFQGEWPGYFNFTRQARKVHRGWEQLHLIDTIPLGVKNGNLKIYPMISSKEGEVFF